MYKERKLPITVARPTFTYGVDDPHKLPLFRSIRKRRFIFIGNGNSTNHPVYIDDLIEGIMLLLERRPVGDVFIIGGPRPVTKMELVNIIGEELGVKTDFLHLPRWIADPAALSMLYLAKIIGFDPLLTPSRVSMMADNWGYSIHKAKTELEEKVKERTAELEEKNITLKVLLQMIQHPLTDIGIRRFAQDWQEVMGKGKIT